MPHHLKQNWQIYQHQLSTDHEEKKSYVLDQNMSLPTTLTALQRSFQQR